MKRMSSVLLTVALVTSTFNVHCMETGFFSGLSNSIVETLTAHRVFILGSLGIAAVIATWRYNSARTTELDRIEYLARDIAAEPGEHLGSQCAYMFNSGLRGVKSLTMEEMSFVVNGNRVSGIEGLKVAVDNFDDAVRRRDWRDIKLRHVELEACIDALRAALAKSDKSLPMLVEQPFITVYAPPSATGDVSEIQV
ncbi:MAG: hypothetical protein NTX86_04085 [Candidatus Dependentiae bacterium]|nr:hypothetical protein [Candidatus Dependentiae bacterium]